jgi:hypothetical protein
MVFHHVIHCLVKTKLPTQTNNFHCFVIFHRKCSISHTYNFLNVIIVNKILKFKILWRMIRKSPAIQWNRQNDILFHETIPLKNRVTRKINST